MIAEGCSGGWGSNMENAHPVLWILQEQGKLLTAATAQEELKGQRSQENM